MKIFISIASYQDLLLPITINSARGPCWARANAQTLLQDEEYFLQVDSHTVFEKDWDEYLIQYIQTIKKHANKPVISAYPRGFEIVDFEKKIWAPK